MLKLKSVDAQRRVPICCLALLVAFGVLGCRKSETTSEEATIAGAVIVKEALPLLAQEYETKHPGVKLRFIYGGSNDLKGQIEGGAPIDGAVLGSPQIIDELVSKDFADKATKKALATDRLALIGRKGTKPLRLGEIDALPPDEKIVIGDPATCSLGINTKAFFQKIGKWDALESRFVLEADPSAVLIRVQRGAGAAGIVYKTGIQPSDDVVVLDEATPDWAVVTVVGIALKKAKGRALAASFIEMIASPAGQALLAGRGFGPP